VARFDTGIRIASPLPAVYRTYLDPTNFPRWVGGYLGMETLEGRPGEVGSEHVIFFGARGRHVAVRETVIAHVPEETFAYVMHSPYTVSSVCVTFEEDGGGGTRLTWRNEVHGRSAAWSLLLPLMVPRMKRSVERNLGRLKRLIEGGT
jgi:uncharacterized protein YndB with AHSA1/START domain